VANTSVISSTDTAPASLPKILFTLVSS
jgi:hypothetical protein